MLRIATLLLIASAYFSPTNALTIDLWNELERDILELVNQDRANLGLGTLNGDSRLHDAAVGHSRDMAVNNFFDHTGSDGSNAGQRAAAAGYNWNSWGENIAAGFLTAESVVNGWLNSPGHRDNMRNGGFTDAGIGFVEGGADADFATYWTLVLAAGDTATTDPVIVEQPIAQLIEAIDDPVFVEQAEMIPTAETPLPPSFWLFAMALATGLLLQRRRRSEA